MTSAFDARPIIVAVVGPNGAGKSTFYRAHLEQAALRVVNADELALELDLGVDPYEAAELAQRLWQVLVEQRESYAFETVLSDPAGDKVEFLRQAAAAGYTVVLCFIGVDRPETCEERVAMRVLQGGHDVPTEKVVARFPHTLANLARAISELPYVLVFDNTDLAHPHRKVAEFEGGHPITLSPALPAWLRWD